MTDQTTQTPWPGFRFGEGSYITGIVNVTPDSFSDGGLAASVDDALKRARQLADEGADILDFGAESTRPNAKPVTAAEELARLEPIFSQIKNERLVETLPPLSIDTTKPTVARAALNAGFRIVNDINGFLAQPNDGRELAAITADFGAGCVLMHNGRLEPIEGDPVAGVNRWFRRSIAVAHAAGVTDAGIVLDPGIGFGKTRDQDIELLRRLDELGEAGYPLLLGASRKRVIARVLDLPVDQRLEGTLATTVAGIAQGVDVFRVHDVRPNRRAAQMADALFR